MLIWRWFFRILLAAGFTSALVFVMTPSGYLADQFQIRPWPIAGQLLAVFAVVFLLVLLGDTIVSWATRKPRTLRMSGVFSFVTGLISGVFALTLWLACLAVFVAPIGIASAWFTLHHEIKEGEGHSLINLAGLLLNAVALGVFISQIITSTVWR